MNLKELLAKLDAVEGIDREERHLSDGTIVYIFFSALPFPKIGSAWCPIVIKPGQTRVPRKEIEAMLRHLWQFQLDIIPEDDEYEHEMPM